MELLTKRSICFCNMLSTVRFYYSPWEYCYVTYAWFVLYWIYGPYGI